MARGALGLLKGTTQRIHMVPKGQIQIMTIREEIARIAVCDVVQ